MIQKIFFVVCIFTAMSFAKTNSEVKTFVIEDNEVEIIIIYPDKIVQGESIHLMGIMKNRYKNAVMGGLTLSFPQIRYTNGTYAKNTFDSISSYSPPDKIYSGITKRNIKSKYYMVEGWEKKWNRGVEKQFFIELKVPSGISHLLVNVRGVLVFGKKKSNRKELAIPSVSFAKDQQGYSVRQLSIPIYKKRTIKKNTTIKKPVEEDYKKQTVTGTGFFINDNILITNQHVVEECKNIEIVRNGYQAKAKIKSFDKTNDLAVLVSDTPNKSFLKFRGGKGVRIGESIIAMGYPLGDLLGTNIKLTLGNISSLNGLLNDSTKLQLTAPVQHGNSGGPLLDNHGNVVGVIYAGLKNSIAQNVNLAIKDNVARMFLDANDVSYNLDMNISKIEVVDIADEAKKSIVQVICHK
ncbi:S1C family serine protease [Sulfurovum sp. ST-21]|uniref:Trypsin-like peptidase domain-containing protein n=1 Tax=Sulfurovum indicum TaxID=2779528 RepID=A0A7M1S2S0_9BACT|nr:serine protease [Sulfurovum indicum]QOR61301.1 trypsin-like peptidase domain-containing protein [Sulfurovum indicum]